MLKLKVEQDYLVAREDGVSEQILDIENDRDVLTNPPSLEGIAVVRLTFPAFKDGRAFTQARELREQGYQGDIRAQGGVVDDQLAFAIRCGFTSFDIETTLSIEELCVQVQRYAQHYQRPTDRATAWEART